MRSNVERSASKRFLRIYLLAFPGILLIWYFQSHITSLPSRLCLNDCSKSLQESDQFICESDHLWNQRKYLYQQQDKGNMAKMPHPIFFLTSWEPNFHCSHAVRVGRMGDGGKWVCDLFRLSSRPDCLVYSAGSNGDFSFEEAMKKAMPHCEIHTFDTNLFKCPENVCTFHQMFLGNGNSSAGSKSWSTINDELGQGNRTVDVLKIDVNGSEYDFVPWLFKSKASSYPRQVLVKVHPRDSNDMHALFESFRANRYVIVRKEANTIVQSYVMEYAFLRLGGTFFE